MKISIVTVCLNSAATIESTLKSVQAQDYPDIEHVVIDGGSSDGTLEILQRHRHHLAALISEPDQGLYDAMNKGISLAAGDVIGLLNADDVLNDAGVISRVAQTLNDSDIDGCYANVVYVDACQPHQIVRHWNSSEYQSGAAAYGWMPAHPTMYIRTAQLHEVGQYRTDIGSQADLEFCVRVFEQHNLALQYIPEVWVRMRTGGVTNRSWREIISGNWRSYRAIRELGYAPNPFTFFARKLAYRLPTRRRN